MSSLQKVREQLGETDDPGTRTPTLRQRREGRGVSARGPPDGLDQHYRYNDLRALNIVPNWPTLSTWIRERGFPPGTLLSPRIRVWSATEIQDWLDKQSSQAA